MPHEMSEVDMIFNVINDEGYHVRKTTNGLELYAAVLGGRSERTFSLPGHAEGAYMALTNAMDYITLDGETSAIFAAVWGMRPKDINRLPRDRRALANRDHLRARSDAVYILNMLEDVRNLLRPCV